jgi:uncharacterized delta-60 repeat protein
MAVGVALLFTAQFLSISPTAAAPGDLDLSFGGFGYQAVVSTPVPSEGMAVTWNGKIATAGTSGVQIVVRRYMPNGVLDASFGTSGTVAVLNPSFAMHATAVAVQADDKIVVVGWADNVSMNQDYLALRLTSTGAVDASFGAGGFRTTDFAGSDDLAAAVVIQPDGKIVLAGSSNVGGDDDFSVARYTSGGSLDPGFSGDGRLTIPFGGGDVCRDVALQPDGKIVVVGDGSDEFPEYDDDVCLARINSNGTLDGSFGGDGRADDVGFQSAGDRATALAILPDGRIVVAGYEWNGGSSYSGKLVRVLPDGTADLYAGVSGSEKLYDLEIQPDGRILLLGEPSSPGEIGIFRRTSGGAADPTFSLNGNASYDAGLYDLPRRMALLPDGRILAHARSGPDFFSPNSTVMIRIWPEGTPDVGGFQAFAFDENGSGFPSGSIEDLKGMVVQPDGKIVVAGWVAHPSSGESDFGCVRFLPDGELDTAFGLNGHTTFSFHNSDIATSVALQPDGKIVVAGYTGSGNGVNFLVARFLPNGALDNTFGFSGFNVIDFMGGPDYASAVAVAPDGKIVIAGGAFNGVNQVVGVARFGPDGIADTSFDLDAKQLVEFEPGATHAGTCVLVQPDGKIVAGGYVNGDFILLRLNESGILDDTFGCQGGIGGGGGVCDGKARVDMGGGDYAYGLARAPNGWLYLGGSRVIDGPSDFAIAQFTENGVLTSCPPFPCENWPSGKAYLNIGNVDYGFALDVRPDGDIVVAGTADGMFAWGQFRPRSPVAYVAAANDMAGQDESVNAVRFDGYNHLVVAGTQIFNSDRNFALAMYETAPNVVTGVSDVSDPQRLAGNAFETLGPNPSGGSTRLAFALAQRSSVSLRVYDASGRLVRAQKVGTLPAGRHQAYWNGLSNGGVPAPAGVYFVNLSADGRDIGTQKLVVLR